MKKPNKGFERLRKAITLSAVGSAGLLGIGTGRAGGSTSTGPCQRNTIRVSSVITNGTSVSVYMRNATVYASSVLASTTPINHNTPNCSSSSNKGSGSSTPVAYGINEASISGVNHSWSGSNYSSSFSSGSSSSDSLEDAFDGYGGMFVDGAPYNDTDGVVDITGTTLTTDPDTMPNGLEASSQYHVFTDKRVTRIIHKLTNPTGSSISTRVAIGGNLGSDRGTYVANTSNNNQTVELGDTWVITHDEYVFGGEATEDPILTHVVGTASGIPAIPLQIPGIQGQPVKNAQVSVSQPPIFDNISFGYDLTIAPGETQYLVWFVQLGSNMSAINAALPNYTDSTSAINAGLYANPPSGMTNTGANWGSAPLAVAGPAQPIPLFSPISLLLLSGLFGFAASRRMRKIQ